MQKTRNLGAGILLIHRMSVAGLILFSILIAGCQDRVEFEAGEENVEERRQQYMQQRQQEFEDS